MWDADRQFGCNVQQFQSDTGPAQFLVERVVASVSTAVHVSGAPAHGRRHRAGAGGDHGRWQTRHRQRLGADRCPGRAAAADLEGGAESVERELVQDALRRHRGKITSAALELGISRPTLYELMEKLGIAKV